jgi:hypothetical protein|tara:strand:- start:727 stop:873 length:147 start_codon:yes stop_codon:yes gene_type:complete
MMYQYKNKKHKDMLTACYFIQHPKEIKVTEQELNDWIEEFIIELEERK